MKWLRWLLDAKRASRTPVQRETVQCDSVGVSVRRLGGVVERVRWDELEAVSIATTDEGPWLEDVFFLLEGPDGTGCAVPQLEAPEELIERMLALPGFSHEAFTLAMGCTSEVRFDCWKRPARARG